MDPDKIIIPAGKPGKLSCLWRFDVGNGAYVECALTPLAHVRGSRKHVAADRTEWTEHDTGAYKVLSRGETWPDIFNTAPNLDEVEQQPVKKGALKTQVGGDHYKHYAIEPVEFTLANGLGFCEGSIIKYVARHRFKGGIEDLKKARHYIDILIEHLDDAEPTP